MSYNPQTTTPPAGGAGRRFILAIDGGGVRGLIPVTALMHLERATGRLSRELFSFVAGTSTGAIIAAAVAAGVPAERIRDLYLTRARTVFTKHWWSLAQRIVSGSMYSTQAVHDLIRGELGSAGDWCLNDSPVDLLITATRVSDGKAWYFVRDNPRNSQRTGRLPLVDCVTASLAEPTYFRPFTIREDPRMIPAGQQLIGPLVGGGVGVANNPVYQACVEAFFYTEGYVPATTTVVSLGTGRYNSLGHPEWIWGWLKWVLDVLLRSPHEQQTEIVHRQFPEMLLYRLDTQLARDISVDAVDSMDELQVYADRFAAQVDWLSILRGTNTSFRINPSNTLWPEYSRPVEPPPRHKS